MELKSEERRSKIEMLFEILQACNKAAKPIRLTHIMYKSNVNCSILKGFLDFLIERKYIEVTHRKHPNSIFYSNTASGLALLRDYNRIIKALKKPAEVVL